MMSGLRRCRADARHHHVSQGNGLGKDMTISGFESAHRYDIHLTVEQGPQVRLEMDLVNDRGPRAELHEEIHIRVRIVVTASYRTEHLDADRMPPSKERLDLVRMGHDCFSDRTHARILTVDRGAEIAQELDFWVLRQERN